MLTVLMLSVHTHAQFTVKGSVKDDAGKPVEAATVGVPGTSNASVTDESGNFELTIPVNRETTVIVRHIAFVEQTSEVNGGVGEVVSLDFKLKLKAIEGNVFTLTEERNREKPMRKIEVADVRLNPSVTGSVESLLPSRALGVSTNNELSSQYSVRGGNFDENLIYVNDVMVYRPFLVRSGQQEGLSFVNGDLVSDISFSSGGFEAKYGDKMSSVLDITYKKPQKLAGSVSAGLLGANVHLENASDNKRFTQLHGFRYYSNQYLLNSTDVQGSYRPYFIDYQTYLTYAPSTDWEFSFLGNYSQNKYQFRPETQKSSFGTISSAIGLTAYFDGQEVDNYRTGFGAFTTTWTPRYDFKMKWITSAFRTQESETFDIEAAYRLSELETDLSKESFGEEAFVIGTGSYLDHARNYLDAFVYSTEIQGQFRPNNHVWLWGLRYQRDEIEDVLREWSMVDSVGFSVPYNGEEVNLFETIRSFNKISTNRVMGYVQRDWYWDVGKHELYLSTGVRSHFWDLNHQTTVSPRAQLSFKPDWAKSAVKAGDTIMRNRDWLFRASWGYYHQPAFYREMRDLFGNVNPAIRAQTSIHYVIGADHNFKMLKRPFKFVGEAYYKQLKGIIPYELDNVRIRYYAKNNADGYATGIDLKLNGEFVKGIESWASISVMQTMEDLRDDQYTLYTAVFDDTTVISEIKYPETVDSTIVYPG
ncbi:MAG: carboxypeptidase-like regulatory domain-containing protein, partial [Flavobacteriales bacterium]